MASSLQSRVPFVWGTDQGAYDGQHYKKTQYDAELELKAWWAKALAVEFIALGILWTLNWESFIACQNVAVMLLMFQWGGLEGSVEL